ncbi:hypothetical protein [Pandoraea sp. NPDC090278]|uniref:hypothetical protein n=1 Tax=Pandoraea sp. NPDC090278 TaxID=3364391 RepID=UPI00383B83D8
MPGTNKQLQKATSINKIARGAGLYAAAQELWTKHPYLKTVADMVAAHLGPDIPGNSNCLLEDCLVDMISAFQSCSRDGRDPVPEVTVALMRRAAQVFRVCVTAGVPSGTIQWDAMKESYYSFLAAHDGASILITRIEGVDKEEMPGESAALLGARLLPEPAGRHIIRLVIAGNSATEVA